MKIVILCKEIEPSCWTAGRTFLSELVLMCTVNMVESWLKITLLLVNGIVPVDFVNFHIFLIKIRNRYGVGTMSKNFRSVR